MRNKSLLMTIAILIIAMSSIAQETSTFTDSRDGKVYKTVTIGTQIWMAENLAYKPSSGNYWAYGNDTNNVKKYGYLYDWETAKTVCHSGWHLPSDAEWTILTTYLGGEIAAGDKLKSTIGWKRNTGATNSSGFSALPGGSRVNIGTFDMIGFYGYWWSSTERGATEAWRRCMIAYSTIVDRIDWAKSFGFSVRCVKD